jgi:hypothetical protein
MLLRLTEDGLYCEAGGFHVDPWRPVDRAVITHAHGDHARWGSRAYLCSREGEGSRAPGWAPRRRIRAVEYGEAVELNGVRVSLHPAGHILGSAQVRVEHRGEVWVVSGDYKTEADPTCTPFEPVRCHTFVTESTFGLPVYRWARTARCSRPSTPGGGRTGTRACLAAVRLRAGKGAASAGRGGRLHRPGLRARRRGAPERRLPRRRGVRLPEPLPGSQDSPTLPQNYWGRVERRSRSRSCSCVRDSRPQGRDAGAAGNSSTVPRCGGGSARLATVVSLPTAREARPVAQRRGTPTPVPYPSPPPPPAPP